MKFDFVDKHLASLYTKGTSKKHKFMTPALARKFVERVNRIEAAASILDLRQPPSMKFEKLEGHENRFSIRLDQKHRLEFEIDFEDDPKTAGTVLIVAVSQHYH